MFVISKKVSLTILAFFFMVSIIFTSGCFHTGASKDLMFPREEPPIEFKRGTIAVNRYNFTGAFTDTRVPVGAEEKAITVDNFYIGKGGGDLYVWAQVHFGADTSENIDFDRYVHVKLIYEPGSDKEMIISQSIYSPQGTGRYDRAELMDTINGTEEGLYSLRVDAVGTAVQEGGVTYYDWYLFTVNGVFSEKSYNNNAPDK
jgi:hypothetical protein